MRGSPLRLSASSPSPRKFLSLHTFTHTFEHYEAMSKWGQDALRISKIIVLISHDQKTGKKLDARHFRPPYSRPRSNEASAHKVSRHESSDQTVPHTAVKAFKWICHLSTALRWYTSVWIAEASLKIEGNKLEGTLTQNNKTWWIWSCCSTISLLPSASQESWSSRKSCCGPIVTDICLSDQHAGLTALIAMRCVKRPFVSLPRYNGGGWSSKKLVTYFFTSFSVQRVVLTTEPNDMQRQVHVEEWLRHR